MADPARLSLNQITVQPLGVAEAAAVCARQGIPAIALWRDKVAEVGTGEAARICAEHGLRVSSLCRGGMFPAATADERRARIDDNRRAVDEAAELGAELLVLVCGPTVGRDIAAARRMVAEGVEALLPYAEERDVTLGVEPLHPMFAADRSVITTLAEANALVRRLASPRLGVVVDVYHVWWDPDVGDSIAAAAGTIVGFHVSDWITPLPDPLLGRGMMGDGAIDLAGLRRAVEAAGYRGPIEVEIMNRSLWERPAEDVLRVVRERFAAHV